jgi:hypothetical protein
MLNMGLIVFRSIVVVKDKIFANNLIDQTLYALESPISGVLSLN